MDYIITDVKIEVSYSMMSDANMIRYGEFGVPVNPKNPSKGLVWKSIIELEDSDFDKIEEYFLNKKLCYKWLNKQKKKK